MSSTPAPAWPDAADTCFMMIMIMTPGLALFYAGMVKKKNAVATMFQSFASQLFVMIQWWFWGYSLTWSNGNGFLGDMSYIVTHDFGMLTSGHPNVPTVPNILFMVYQGMFATITPALITGAVAERLRFRTFVVFLFLWSTLVYAPVAHWIWAPTGWLYKLGALDLAVAIGTALIWFGWQGFNGGSALRSGVFAAVSWVNTNLAASAGGVAWMMMDWINLGKPTFIGACNGIVTGLVAITPAAGFIQVPISVLCGATASIFIYWFIKLKAKLIDDSLDAFAIHGMGGAYGCMFTGVFASSSFVSTVANVSIPGGWWDQNWVQVPIQLAAVVATAGWSMTITFIILLVFWKIPKMGWSVSLQDEEIGLDMSEHGEQAYTFLREEEEEAEVAPILFSWARPKAVEQDKKRRQKKMQQFTPVHEAAEREMKGTDDQRSFVSTIDRGYMFRRDSHMTELQPFKHVEKSLETIEGLPTKGLGSGWLDNRTTAICNYVLSVEVYKPPRERFENLDTLYKELMDKNHYSSPVSKCHSPL
ncbi:ammonium transporter MEP2 [Acrasis kona]|uniref:Ammonium transporter MEP2 n=1 Tax=Acrasis kona TaxID=1008807 RepID=A0AAW2ZM49_9EUKA